MEITPWKKPGCALKLDVDALSQRSTCSTEINNALGGGGGLNANYRTVEAIAIAANRLGQEGITYNEHFIFKTGGNTFELDFADETSKAIGERVLHNAVVH